MIHCECFRTVLEINDCQCFRGLLEINDCQRFRGVLEINDSYPEMSNSQCATVRGKLEMANYQYFRRACLR